MLPLTQTIGLASLVALVPLAALLIWLGVRRPKYALYCMCFTIPLESLLRMDVLGTLPRIFGVLLFASWALNLVVRPGRRIKWNLVSGWGWLWMVWLTASLLWSIEPSLIGLRMVWPMFVFAFVVADLVSRESDLAMSVLAFYTSGALLACAFAIAKMTFPLDSSGMAIRVAAFEGQSVALFAGQLLPALLFVFDEMLRSGGSLRKRVAMFGLFGILVVALAISGTRSAWLGVTAGLAYVIVRRVKPKQLLAYVVLILVLGTMLSQLPGMSDFVGQRLSTAVDSGGAGRTDIWKVGLGIFQNRPLVGVGFYNFPKAFTTEAIDRAPFALKNINEVSPGMGPHNIYLSNAVELGIVGIAVWVLWTVRLLFANRPRDVGILLQGILWAYMIHGFFQDILTETFFWMVVGLAQGLIQATRNASRDHEEA